VRTPPAHGAAAGGPTDEHLLRSGREGEALVFGRTPADPFVPSTINNRAQECWAAGELEPITLHECRHTFASLLIDAGANPKAIQTFMGHSKIQTTFDTYGHLMPGSHDEVRERMDQYLRGSGRGSLDVSARDEADLILSDEHEVSRELDGASPAAAPDEDRRAQH
jgi:hypothetical protein